MRFNKKRRSVTYRHKNTLSFPFTSHLSILWYLAPCFLAYIKDLCVNFPLHNKTNTSKKITLSKPTDFLIENLTYFPKKLTIGHKMIPQNLRINKEKIYTPPMLE